MYGGQTASRRMAAESRDIRRVIGVFCVSLERTLLTNPMSPLPRFCSAASVAAVLLLAACDSSILDGPLSHPPAMAVPAVVSVSTTRIEMQVTNLAHHYLEYGACFDRSLDRLTPAGWQTTSLADFNGVCAAVGLSLSGYGSTATIGVLVVGTPAPGEYRVRMRFSHRDGRVEGVSNIFRIE